MVNDEGKSTLPFTHLRRVIRDARVNRQHKYTCSFQITLYFCNFPLSYPACLTVIWTRPPKLRGTQSAFRGCSTGQGGCSAHCLTPYFLNVALVFTSTNMFDLSFLIHFEGVVICFLIFFSIALFYEFVTRIVNLWESQHFYPSP